MLNIFVFPGKCMAMLKIKIKFGEKNRLKSLPCCLHLQVSNIHLQVKARRKPWTPKLWR